jgi:UDP-N-acetylmuramate: L-alanyl-gamma-D-glutamyl-meso-diaminopimelate ligase
MTIKKIHLIGVCGVAMGTLACMLRDCGYLVQGSDQNVYPPMSDVLKNSGITLFEGFNQDNIGNADLVVIGNAISRGNPEVEHILNRKIPYCSMAGALYRFFLQEKEVIAVTGTHGKSTTTALLAHILESAGESPSFLVGGVLNNYDSNYRLGTGKYFVIEGDEYDSAFFEKVPKFIFYRPDHLIMTSLEFDHADIFSDLAEIELWFERLVNMIPSNGNIVYNDGFQNLKEIASPSPSRLKSYGNNDSLYSCRFNGYGEAVSFLELVWPSDKLSLETTLMGEFNYQNITAAAAMALELGIKKEEIALAIQTFKGVRRRMDIIFSNPSVTVYEDFAHHPTAIAFILSTLRDRYPDRKVWAIYEPRSATSKRNVFKDRLPLSFMDADYILMRRPGNTAKIPESERLDAGEVCSEIRHLKGSRTAALDFEDGNAIASHLADVLNPEEKHVIVIMSNGGFDSIYEIIQEVLKDLFERTAIRT